MKNAFKFLGIIVLATVIGFSFISCGDDNGNGDSDSGGGVDVMNGTYEGQIRLADSSDWVDATAVVSGGNTFKITGDFDEINGTLAAPTVDTSTPIGGFTMRVIIGPASVGDNSGEYNLTAINSDVESFNIYIDESFDFEYEE